MIDAEKNVQFTFASKDRVNLFIILELFFNLGPSPEKMPDFVKQNVMITIIV